MRTEVGYAGGRTANPTYHRIGDHTEAVDVDFDPQVIPYQALLDIFWDSHDPTAPGRSTQYKPALFCHSDAQLDAALASRDALSTRLGTPVRTEIVRDAPYYPAEGYHQKWRLRRHQALFEDLQGCFASEAALLRSVAAARLNGFVGRRDPELAELIDKLGLSEEGKRRLRDA